MAKRGVIKRKVEDRGFGFIRSGQVEYFFHRSECKSTPFEELKANDKVKFEIEDSPKGPRAAKVERIGSNEYEEEWD